MRILVIGAGPIGLEAALQALSAGHEVTVVESGGQVADGVRSWQHVDLFSPWSLNTSPAGLAALTALDCDHPDPAEFPDGSAFCELYLEPIAEYLVANGATLRLDTDVVAVGRGRLRKPQHIGDAVRASTEFRVLVDAEDGEEMLRADVVIDCSGVLDSPNFLGTGGIPALGEAEADERITRRIPDFAGPDADHFANKTVLVVGAGMSAATTIDGLLGIKAEQPRTTIIWATSRSAPLYQRIENDPLPGRDRPAGLGNAAAAGDLPLSTLGGYTVARITVEKNDKLRVALEDEEGKLKSVTVDELIANVGYRPNTAIFEELQVHQCYATQGTMKLAASLLAAEGGADCLTQEAPGPDLLRNPEPGFFVLGAKSYGRNSNFLIRVGVEQVTAVMGIIGG